MNFFKGLRKAFNWAFGVFVSAALWFYRNADLPVIGWVCETLGDLCNDLADFCADCASWLFDAEDWWDWVSDRVEDILDKWDILGLLKTWLDWAEWAWNWVRNAANNVRNIITDWWSGILPYIIGYVDQFADVLLDLKGAWDDFRTKTFPEWIGKLTNLLSDWTDFLINTLPTLVSFSWLTTWWSDKLQDINSLIISALQEWFPFYNDLVALWNEIAEFFADPMEWLLGRFTDWFLGKEK